MKKYRYFVSFSLCSNPTGAIGYGNAIIKRDFPIETAEELSEISDLIIFDGESKIKSIVILNFILLKVGDL